MGCTGFYIWRNLRSGWKVKGRQACLHMAGRGRCHAPPDNQISGELSRGQHLGDCAKPLETTAMSQLPPTRAHLQHRVTVQHEIWLRTQSHHVRLPIRLLHVLRKWFCHWFLFLLIHNICTYIQSACDIFIHPYIDEIWVLGISFT